MKKKTLSNRANRESERNEKRREKSLFPKPMVDAAMKMAERNPNWGTDRGETFKVGDTVTIGDRAQAFKFQPVPPTALSLVLQGIRFHSATDKAACLEAVDRYVRTQTAAMTEELAANHKDQVIELRGQITRLTEDLREAYRRWCESILQRQGERETEGF